ncbi:MAG TPA: hypothetical protein PLR99_20915 [Polyangiaceae bacterium]|nr:hypothetical protein [Polyangiaceae bacterium]
MAPRAPFGRGVAAVLALAAGLGAARGHAAPQREAGPLPFLPSVARVRVGITKERMVVTHALTLPRGEWKGGDLDLYFAYGGPGAPVALDAHLHHVADGELEAHAGAGEAVTYDRVPRRPPSAHALIGRPQMAGVVLHVKEAAFRAAAADGMAELRVRALYTLPVEGQDHEREARVRLGASGGAPLTLARVQVGSLERDLVVSRAEARLCGPDAEGRPLSVLGAPKALAPAGSVPAPPPVAPIAPALAVRHASDDLCVRVWTSASAEPGRAAEPPKKP